jgi:Rrf2 family iron-sulfur cluster assembly transcriptional regulator
MFTISTKIQYGLLALIALADKESKGPVPLGSIAQELNLSFKYLEHIFKLLTRGRIVRGTRGPDGGYILGKQPANLSLAEIFVALDGPLFTVECLDEHAICNHFSLCPVRDLWKDFQHEVGNYLDRQTLANVIRKSKKAPLRAHIDTHAGTPSKKRPHITALKKEAE